MYATDISFGLGISIHVPARGTTLWFPLFPHLFYISIHVPARGTTFASSDPPGPASNFNPRPREGNDAKDMMLGNYKGISIHVPARGTTTFRELVDYIMGISIHVPARGTTCRLLKYNGLYIISIHVPARGTTTIHSIKPIKGNNFNPRPREGNDVIRWLFYSQNLISIHVPARGTTAK